jgi:hypothetical protein
MNSALLQNLLAGAGLSSQFIGGLVVALTFLSFDESSKDDGYRYLLDLFPVRDCGLLPEFRCLFLGPNSCLAN